MLDIFLDFFVLISWPIWGVVQLLPFHLPEVLDFSTKGEYFRTFQLIQKSSVFLRTNVTKSLLFRYSGAILESTILLQNCSSENICLGQTFNARYQRYLFLPLLLVSSFFWRMWVMHSMWSHFCSYESVDVVQLSVLPVQRPKGIR